jgi:hypothetical protein
MERKDKGCSLSMAEQHKISRCCSEGSLKYSIRKERETGRDISSQMGSCAYRASETGDVVGSWGRKNLSDLIF